MYIKVWVQVDRWLKLGEQFLQFVFSYASILWPRGTVNGILPFHQYLRFLFFLKIYLSALPLSTSNAVQTFVFFLRMNLDSFSGAVKCDLFFVCLLIFFLSEQNLLWSLTDFPRKDKQGFARRVTNGMPLKKWCCFQLWVLQWNQSCKDTSIKCILAPLF